jgi:osmoprotectant transport system ATP-binding protein
MIEFNGVSKYYDGVAAVSDLNLHCPEGAFTVLLGSSGSGKSTTLKMINRLEPHDSGTLLFGGQDVRRIEVKSLRRRIGYAIQSVGLFPHWTVARNIATVPSLLGWDRARIEARIDELLALLGLEDDRFRNSYPHQLSGGQQQRVGVARALAADPEVLLMDEPFGALDPVTRSSLQQEVRRIHQLQGRTFVLVTHDVDEALLLADQLVVMDQGRVIQQGSPAELLNHPATPFVRDFFGGSELGVRLLARRVVGQWLRPGEWLEGIEPIDEQMTLREALSRFVEQGCQRLPVQSANGERRGVLHFCDLAAQEPRP